MNTAIITKAQIENKPSPQNEVKLPQGGELYVNMWGTTMRRVVFYQVISKEKGKNKYYLTRPIVESSGNVCAGETKVIGPSTSTVVVAHAKMHRGRFVLCNNDFTIKSYCPYLDLAQPGDSHSEWSD